MIRNLLLPALAIFVFPATGRADEADLIRLKQLDSEIREVEAEIVKLSETPLEPGGLFDAQGQVNPRITDSVVIIEGDRSVGTGFIAATGGKKYVYTCAHVFSGNNRLTVRNSSGTNFKKFADLEAAEGGDLVRMEILEEVRDFLEFRPAEPRLQINREIAALGNGGGNGVVAVERGLVLGTSPDSIEVDAAIIPGNSGGPVVEVATGRVAGVATHLTLDRKAAPEDGTRQGKVHRFACRVDKDWEWKTLKIGVFLENSKAVDEYCALTDVCYAILAGLPVYGDGRVVSAGSRDPWVQGIFSKNSDQEMVKIYREMCKEMYSRKVMPSVSETKKKYSGMLATLVTQATRTQNVLKPQTYAWFHRNRATIAMTEREKCIGEMNEELEKMK